MYRVAICDDDELYREIIKKAINEQNIAKHQLEYYEYESGNELLKDVNKQHDLIFLDIQMPGLNGNETAKFIRENNKAAVLVFCTNYNSITPEIIKVRPFRYIIKDINDKNLKSELPHVLSEMLREAEVQYVTATCQDFVKRIPLKDILYISNIKHGAEITLYDGNENVKIRCKETVRELYYKLESEGFAYAHNSYIVNLANIIGQNKQIIKLKDDTELKISRSRKKSFEEKLITYFHSRRYE